MFTIWFYSPQGLLCEIPVSSIIEGEELKECLKDDHECQYVALQDSSGELIDVAVAFRPTIKILQNIFHLVKREK